MAYHPDVTVRPRTVHADLRYDGSVALVVASDLYGRDGHSLNHGHTHIYRFAPNAWHGLTAHAALGVTVAAQHAALGVASLDATAPFYLYPRDYPSDGTRRRRPPPPRIMPGQGDYDASVFITPARVSLHALYCGDLVVTTYGALRDADGRALGYESSHEHDVPPDAWSTTPLPALVEAAVDAHHAVLGLNAPQTSTHPHLLHTARAGYPALGEPPPLPAATPVDANALRVHLARAAAQDHGFIIPPHLHPALGDYTPTIPPGLDARMEEMMRRDAIMARKRREA